MSEKVMELLDKRINEIAAQIENMAAQYNALVGSLNEARSLRESLLKQEDFSHNKTLC